MRDTLTFNENNLGVKLNSAAEIIQFHALADFTIWDADGYPFDYPVETTDEDGNTQDREATETEVLERALDAFRKGETVYAGLYIDGVKIVPDKATTLQSDFYLGQTVYTMHNNKIVQGVIIFLTMSASSKTEKVVRIERTAERIYNAICKELNMGNAKNYWVTSHRAAIDGIVATALNDESVIIDINDCPANRAFNEIFATKEELINHLMEG